MPVPQPEQEEMPEEIPAETLPEPVRPEPVFVEPVQPEPAAEPVREPAEEQTAVQQPEQEETEPAPVPGVPEEISAAEPVDTEAEETVPEAVEQPVSYEPEEPATEQPEERFEVVDTPSKQEKAEEPEEETNGFRIVEKAVQMFQSGYVFSHADDLARAASDALSQFSILTEQELGNAAAAAGAPEKAAPEKKKQEEMPAAEEQQPVISTEEEQPDAAEPEAGTEEHTEPETFPEDMLPEGAYVTEVTEPVPATEEVLQETPEEEPSEPVLQFGAPAEEGAERDTGEDLVEDFIPTHLIREQQEAAEAAEEKINVPEEPETQPVTAEQEEMPEDTVKSGVPADGKEDDVPISFEEFRFYTRREKEPEKTAQEQEQQISEEDHLPQESAGEREGFSFEGEQEPAQEEKIPELMYTEQELPEEHRPAQQEGPVSGLSPEKTAEEPEEKTVFRQENASEQPAEEEMPAQETAPEQPAVEETPAQETAPEESHVKETPAEPIHKESGHQERKDSGSASRNKKKKNRKTKKASKGNKPAEDGEDAKKKKEIRKILAAVAMVIAVIAAAAIGGWYWYNMPENVYARYMSGALKAAGEGDVITAAADFNEALRIKPDSVQASEQLDRLYAEANAAANDYMDKQMFAEAYEQTKLLTYIRPSETENNTAALKNVFMEWAAASARTGNDQDIQHVLDMASSELSREDYSDVENSAMSAKAGFEFADFFMNNGDKLLELNDKNDRVAVFSLLDSMYPKIKEYAQRSGTLPVRTGKDSQGREAAFYFGSDSMLQLYIGNFDSSGNRTGEGSSYLITSSQGVTEYAFHKAKWTSGAPNGSFEYYDLASDYNGAERGIAKGTLSNGYFDGKVSMTASDGYTYSVSFSSGTVKVVAEAAPDGQKNVIGYAADGEKWLCMSDDQVSERHGIPYVAG